MPSHVRGVCGAAGHDIMSIKDPPDSDGNGQEVMYICLNRWRKCKCIRR